MVLMVSCMVQEERDHGVVKTDRVTPGLCMKLVRIDHGVV